VPVLPADDLAYQPVTVSLEALKALALQRRPEVAAQSRLVARQFAVKSARSQWLPDFLLLAHFGESERTLRVTAPRLAVGIALPFFDFGRIHGEIRAAKAQVTEQEALLEQTKRVILAEVETAVKKLTASQIVVEGFQKRIVPAAEDLLKRVQASYAEGGSTLLEVLDAQQTWRTTRKELVKAIADYLKALAELERAIGGTLPVTGETANGKGTNGEG
jgi:cobalt-zinc-cadmium efflux system outer membrane protein